MPKHLGQFSSTLMICDQTDRIFYIKSVIGNIMWHSCIALSNDIYAIPR